MAQDQCSRCKGKGYGDWVVMNGVCFRCQGSGSEKVAKRLAAKREIAARIAQESEDAFVTVEAGSQRDARFGAARAFGVMSNDLGTEVEPGLWVVTFTLHPDWAPPASWPDPSDVAMEAALGA